MDLSSAPTGWLLALFLVCVLVCSSPFSYAEVHGSDDIAHPALRPNSAQIIRAPLLRNAVLPCNFTVNGSTEHSEYVEWWYKGYGHTLIGSFDLIGRVALTNWTREGAYQVLDNGTLAIRNARRELVERYNCVVFNGTGSPLALHVCRFRLDFSSWYALVPGSLFVGSCIAAVVICAATFLLNMIWIVCRNSILWWIRRAERMSRVRALIVALEKYRHKQMESMHETYSRRVSTIRDNYHAQVDQLRQSYADSADRFRGYRQTQMDHVQQHLDSIRDNYCQQMSRLREFGSRRIESIWDGYDRSMTALRTFTMEQRLRMVNQYKVKQRYVNKLLEAIAAETNAEIISKREAAIREALGEADPPWLHHPHASAASFGGASITRSASYYSLPDFALEEDEWWEMALSEDGPFKEDVLQQQQQQNAIDDVVAAASVSLEEDQQIKQSLSTTVSATSDNRTRGVRFAAEVVVSVQQNTVCTEDTGGGGDREISRSSTTEGSANK